jgi:formamidopyrimidine-DNA glycosylase
MPELPEVHTTVTALEKMLVGLRVVDIWTDYNSPYYHGKDQIKDPAYFKFFKKEIMGKKIVHVSRRAKNILIHLSGNKISESDWASFVW